MNVRKDFGMTPEEFDQISDACRPVPYMIFGGMEPPAPQENANRAWQSLADKRGFVWDTVEPSGKGDRFFSAEVKE
jgi:predicted TIM-barrel fold metal-dependent hydrolase